MVGCYPGIGLCAYFTYVILYHHFVARTGGPEIVDMADH